MPVLFDIVYPSSYWIKNENVTIRPCRHCVTMHCRCLHARAPVAVPSTCSEHLQRRSPRRRLQSRGDDDLISLTLPLPSAVNRSIAGSVRVTVISTEFINWSVILRRCQDLTGWQRFVETYATSFWTFLISGCTAQTIDLCALNLHVGLVFL